MSTKILDLAVHCHFCTDKAVKVSKDGDADKSTWLPLSQVEPDTKDQYPIEATIEMQIPEWLAKEKGLI